MNVNLKKLRENAVIPTYGSAFSAGADLYACLESDLVIEPGQTVLVPTGIALEIPTGYVGLVFARSGLATKRDLAPANKVGVIDCDYRGEILVSLHNHGKVARTVVPAERIAQLVLVAYFTADFSEVQELSESARGVGGFGSTGRK